MVISVLTWICHCLDKSQKQNQHEGLAWRIVTHLCSGHGLKTSQSVCPLTIFDEIHRIHDFWFLPSSLNQLIISEVCILHGSLFQYFLCGTLLVAHVANLTCCVSYFPDWQLCSAGAPIELTDPALTVWTVTLSLRVNTRRWDLCDIVKPPPSLLSSSLPFLLLCSHPALFNTWSDQNTFLWKDLFNSSHCDL